MAHSEQMWLKSNWNQARCDLRSAVWLRLPPLSCATSQNKEGAEVKWPTHPDVTQVLTTISGASCQHSHALWRFSARVEPGWTLKATVLPGGMKIWDVNVIQISALSRSSLKKRLQSFCVLQGAFFPRSLTTWETTDVWHHFTFGRIKEFRRVRKRAVYN